MTARPNRKKALIIVDVQKAFVSPRNMHVVKNIEKLLKSTAYDLYVATIFHAEKGSIWDKQQKWTRPKSKDTITLPEIRKQLEGKNVIFIEKETKSVFKGKPDITNYLKRKRIEEIHVVGYQTDDCVLATAYESFDLGFLTYVVENCCQSSSGKLHKEALSLLRHQNMVI